MSYDVTITISLKIEPAEGKSLGPVVEGLHNLAEIMLVQSEDGVYALGSPDADDYQEVGPNGAPGRIIKNEYLASIESAIVSSIVVE